VKRFLLSGTGLVLANAAAAALNYWIYFANGSDFNLACAGFSTAIMLVLSVSNTIKGEWTK
jgi:hypothetical protein